MKLSIVTIAYADSTALSRTCQSVDRQTTAVEDHIIVASGFSDAEKLSLAGQLSRPGRSFFFDRDTSIYNAMNLGQREASGTFVLFLNAGDVLASNGATELVVQRAKPGRCCAFSTAQIDGDHVYIRSPGKWKCDVLCYPGHQGFVAPLATAAVDRIYFNEQNLISADREWMEICMRTYGVDPREEVLAEFALGGISNLPSWRGCMMQIKAKRYSAAAKFVAKLAAFKMLGRHRYFYIGARLRGYEVQSRL